MEIRAPSVRLRRTPRAVALVFASMAAFAAIVTTAVPASAAVIARPALESPANHASVQSLPTFAWRSARRAASYQFQLAADAHFGAIVFQGSFATFNTAATLNQAVPDGTYYWRARGITAKDAAGPWSRVRMLRKAWSAAPQLVGPNGTTVNWPSAPLVFSWSSVPHAVRYILTVATDSALGNQVIGSASLPLMTQGTQYTPSASLTKGTYYWAVTPLDAEGHKGQRSAVGSFTYSWPTTTPTTVSDLNPDPRVFDPFYSWAPVPGAARYQVEVNAAADFPAGSKWCCTNTTLGTSMAPLRVLANNGYYWRMRAIDANGNTGVWNYGQSFTKAFDDVTPTIPSLNVVDTSGNAVTNSAATPVITGTPIVTWNPVPGASHYEVQLAPYVGSCDWSQVASHPFLSDETASNAWTPLGHTITRVGPTAWPAPQQVSQALPTGEYCLRVLARSDDDAQSSQVISDWTQINGSGNPAFYYTGAPSPAGPAVQTPAGNYILPAYGTSTTRTPLFTWTTVPGALGYYVVVSRDAGFTRIADIGYTNVPAYAPRLGNQEPLSDETTHYYWAVIPAPAANGTGFTFDNPGGGDDNPRMFDKSSAPPTLLSPAPGTNISTQPTFQWTGAENARSYTLQVSADPTFGNPIDNVVTDATAYTSDSTYPADKQLYWRVRANDWIGQGLNWSQTYTFVRSLPAPVLAPSNEAAGENIPVLDWAPVQGATGYELHVDWSNGQTSNVSLTAPAFTPVQWNGVGVWRYQVRADFPTSVGSTATSGYSPAGAFTRLLKAPSRARGVKTGTRLVISWNPDFAAKQYEVDISTTDGFATVINSVRTDNTSWAPNINLQLPQNHGRLYWRVAAVDLTGNVGSFATGAFGKQRAPHRAHHKKHKKHKK